MFPTRACDFQTANKDKEYTAAQNRPLLTTRADRGTLVTPGARQRDQAGPEGAAAQAGPGKRGGTGELGRGGVAYLE